METRSNLRKVVLLAGAALLSTGALATPTDEPVITETETVKYSVPELETAPGAKALYRKLRAAATRVCSQRMPATKIPVVDRDCAADALSKAVADVGNPLLIALHLQMQGGSRMAGARAAQSAESETLASR
jgi:UrcA family protein